MTVAAIKGIIAHRGDKGGGDKVATNRLAGGLKSVGGGLGWREERVIEMEFPPAQS